jgi:hypothetical protein
MTGHSLLGQQVKHIIHVIKLNDLLNGYERLQDEYRRHRNAEERLFLLLERYFVAVDTNVPDYDTAPLDQTFEEVRTRVDIMIAIQGEIREGRALLYKLEIRRDRGRFEDAMTFFSSPVVEAP